MNFDTNDWKPFKLGSLFNIERGRGARITDINNIDGKTAIITSTENFNGLSGFTINSPCHEGNVITVNRNGSVAESFYQPKPFCSTEDVHVLNPKFILTPSIGLFLATVIRMEKYRFGYGRKWGLARMRESIIYLPTNCLAENDTIKSPDWLFMEAYIKSLNIDFDKNLTAAHIESDDKKELCLNEWKYFKLSDYFLIDICRSININKTKSCDKSKSIALIGRSDFNNGVKAFIEIPSKNHVHSGKALSIPMVGSVFDATFQDTQFCATQNIATLRMKPAIGLEINSYLAMFLITVIKLEKYKYSYGRTLSLGHLNKMSVKLPVDENGQPNWDFMENYIKSLRYSSVI